MIPALSQGWKDAYDGIKNVGVVCLIFKLKKSVTPNFWVNISDPSIKIPGFVEFSNLRNTSDTIVYVPYYMPIDNPIWRRSNEQLLDEAFGYLRRINPSLTDADRIDAAAGRLLHARPVCPPGFACKDTEGSDADFQDCKSRTPVTTLRTEGVSEGIRWARLLAAAITDPLLWEKHQ